MKVCPSCGKEFYVIPCRVATSKYCSFTCLNKSQDKKVERICLNCSKEFRAHRSVVKNGRGRFCGTKCKYQYDLRIAHSDGPQKLVSYEKAKELKTRSRKGRKRYLDNVFSKMIRSRDGKCVRCGTIDKLQCAHVIPRTRLKLRYDPDNAITLCLKCHIYWWHKNPFEAANWFNSVWPGRYDRLIVKERELGKVDLDEVLAKLKEGNE